MTLAAIRVGLAEPADAERAAGMARYFQARPGGYGEGDRFLGIGVPAQRALARRHAASTSLADVDELLSSPWHEGFLAPRYGHMPRTMLRYAIERFPADRRREYLAGRV